VTHWKSMTERDWLFAFDLAGKDVTLTIDRVVAGELTGTGGKKSRKPVVHFKEGKEKKPLALCVTNCKVIASMYTNDVEKWVGKRVTLYPTVTQFAGEEVECIRVRPRIPNGKADGGAPEPGSDG
jgi:hypothetical protein